MFLINHALEGISRKSYVILHLVYLYCIFILSFDKKCEGSRMLHSMRDLTTLLGIVLWLTLPLGMFP